MRQSASHLDYLEVSHWQRGRAICFRNSLWKVTQWSQYQRQVRVCHQRKYISHETTEAYPLQTLHISFSPINLFPTWQKSPLDSPGSLFYFRLTSAMGKATKSTRKFAASGQLKKQIQDRRKHQQIKKRAQTKRATKHGKASQQQEKIRHDEEGGGVEEHGAIGRHNGKGKSKGSVCRFRHPRVCCQIHSLAFLRRKSMLVLTRSLLWTIYLGQVSWMKMKMMGYVLYVFQIYLYTTNQSSRRVR
jgi:hypothetical protein